MEFDLEMYQSEWQSRTLNSAGRLETASQNTTATQLIKRMKQSQVKQFVLYLLTLIAIVLINRYISGVITTSEPGYYILLGCALYYTVLKLFLLTRLQTIRLSESVTETIRQIKVSRNYNQHLLLYAEWIYSCVLSAGVYLYLQPVFEKMLYSHPEREYIIYLVMLAYLLWTSFYAFYIKRREIRRDLKRLESLLEQLNPDHLSEIR